MTTDERAAWIALGAATGVGFVTFTRLLERFGTAAAALDELGGLAPARIEHELTRGSGTRPHPGTGRSVQQAAADRLAALRSLEALDAWALIPQDADYPTRLHDLEEPPLVLYGRGALSALAAPRMVAVVGTRRPTMAGRDLAARVAARLVDAGVVVVSGLAMGIDSTAHRATLDAAGRTVAVIGSGLDQPGPAANGALVRRLVQEGALVGELAPGVRASVGTFPRRNRIISALSSATIVVEAPARSGALITARHTLEQGRTLLVAPGRPLDRRVAGCLALLRETPARPLVGLDEMVVDLGFDTAPGDRPSPRQLSLAAALDLLGPQERLVAAALATGPASLDTLCSASGLSAREVAAVMTILQLRGWARVLGAMQLPAGPLLGDGADG